MSEEVKSSSKSFLRHPIQYFLNPKAASGECVPNREIIFYGMGIFGQNMTYGIVSQWFFYFCTNVLKITPMHVGILTSISRVWDAVNDPIVGTFIDRAPVKNGTKLHRYLGKLALIIGALTVLLFFNPGFSETGLIIWVLVIYLLWDMTYSFQDVAIWGTLSLLSPNSEERTKASQWVTIFASAGGVVVGIIPILMNLSNAAGLSERTLFLLCALVFGFGGEAMSMLVLKTHERILHPDNEEKESFIKQLFDIRKNKILVALIAAQTLGGLSLTVPWIYFFKYCVSYQIGNTVIPGETVQTIYGILSGLPGAVSMLIATKLMNKLGGHKRALIFAQVFQIIVRIFCFFIGYNTIPKLVIVALLMAVTSVPTGIMSIVNRSFLCDSVDYMEWKTGRRTEGIVSSLQNFVAKISSALQTFINGLLLSLLKFDNTLEGITGQPEAFYKWMWPLFILGPAVGAALYVIPLLLLKYTPEERKTVETALKEKRAAEMQEKN